MKVKSWLKYLIFTSLILIIVFYGQYVLEGIRKNAEKTYDINIYYSYGTSIIFYGGIGLVLGLEHIINEAKQEGTWKINLPKIVLMVLPSLYFSLGPFIYFNNLTILSFPIGVLIQGGEGGATFINTFKLILGYSIITSFYKEI